MLLISILIFLIPVLVYPEPILGVLKNEYIVKNYALIFIAVYLCYQFLIKLFKKFSFGIKNSTKLYIVFFLVSVVSYIINGGSPNKINLVMIFVYGVIFAKISSLEKRINSDAFANVWLSVAGCTGLYGIYQFCMNKQVVSMLGNRNFFACFIISGIPFIVLSIYGSFKQKKYPKFTISILVLLLSIVNLYFAGSRAAWLILILGVTSCLLIFSKRKLITALILLMFIPVLFTKSNAAFIKENIRGDVRPYIWEATFDMISDSPVFGVGPGNFVLEYPKYRVPEYFLLSKSTDNTSHAHNEWLELWAESGAMAFFAILGLFLLIGKSVFDLFKQKKVTPFILCLLFSAGSIFLHNMVDVNMRFTSTSVVFWVCLGILSNLSEPSTAVSLPKWLGYFKIPVFFLCSCAAIFLVWTSVVKSAVSEICFQKGIDAKERNLWEDAVLFYNKGLDYNSDYLSLKYHLGYAYDKLGRTDKAIQVYSDIVNTAPYYALVRKNLGTCYLKTGDFNNALIHYSVQKLLNPYDPDLYLNMSYCYSKINDHSSAQMLRKQAVDIYCKMSKNYIDYRDYKKALYYLETVAQIVPDNQNVTSLLGDLYVFLEKPKKTTDLYRKFLIRNHGNILIKSKLSKLDN